MFTGLVETTGTIRSITPSIGGATRIAVSAPSLTPRLHTGDSVAVSGVCLTALDITANEFHADLAAETIERTTLVRLAPGTLVNLELPTPAGSPLGGHVVQGHVDGTAILRTLVPIQSPASHDSPTSQSDWRLTLDLPESLVRYVVPQGSITVEGISLTVASIQDRQVEIAVIPHTYASTSLHTLAPGTPLNIEVDVLAKYAERQQKTPPSFVLTESYLLQNGY